MAYVAGLRWGELVSLTWSDIDFETGEVRVENEPATSAMPQFWIKDYEERRISLPKRALDILREPHNQAPERVRTRYLESTGIVPFS